MRRTRIYGIWGGMISRCHNPHVRCFHRYGGRGIYVCERWRTSFENFLADMGECPVGCSLDRIDNEGPYSPENCRWATALEQGRNKRNNVKHEGRTLSEWSRELGMDVTTMRTRVRKWGWERAISQPIRGRS